MPEPDSTTLILHQLDSMRRELRVLRSLLVFVCVVVGLFLFAPGVPPRVAECVEWMFSRTSGAFGAILGTILALGFATIVVSHRADRRRTAATTNALKESWPAAS